jgi:hypothetical protein
LVKLTVIQTIYALFGYLPIRPGKGIVQIEAQVNILHNIDIAFCVKEPHRRRGAEPA